MKKLTKLLALALAAMMLLSTGALAAENEGEEEAPTKLLWMQWIDGETLEPNSPVHRNNPCQQTPYDRFTIALYTCDDDGSNEVPVPADQLKADAALKVRALAPNEKGKEHYIEVDCAGCEWGKEYTIAYGEYSFIIDCRLPDVGMYSAPEATTENYIPIAFNFSPLMKESFCYVISTATDETQGRHLTGMALNKDCEDNAAFKLEKVSDTVYKLTLTGSVDVQDYHPVVDVTWQNVKFMGGDTYVEQAWLHAWEAASTLISDKDTSGYADFENVNDYYELKDDFRNTLTLKAGESATVYTAFTYFPGDPAKWIVRAVGAPACQTKDKDLKLTPDANDRFKLTVSSDVPGTYTFYVDNSYWWPSVNGITHANGKPYTEAEFKKWDEDTLYTCDADTFYIVTYDEDDNRTLTPFEEAFPGETIDWDSHYERDIWAPVTVTVTGEAPKPAFTDVKTSDWFAPAVSYANGKGYMNGNEGKFDPTGRITGAQFAQILYNKEGKPAAAEGAAFQGVTDQWYAPAVLWAAGKGVVTDTGDAAIVPTADLTREQIALMLYSYMGKPEAKGDLTAFTDEAKVSAWAKDAMAWAVGEGVLKGSGNALDPTGTATRAETAQILMNFFK